MEARAGLVLDDRAVDDVEFAASIARSRSGDELSDSFLPGIDGAFCSVSRPPTDPAKVSRKRADAFRCSRLMRIVDSPVDRSDKGRVGGPKVVLERRGARIVGLPGRGECSGVGGAERGRKGKIEGMRS